jgi:hypothetical protein
MIPELFGPGFQTSDALELISLFRMPGVLRRCRVVPTGAGDKINLLDVGQRLLVGLSAGKQNSRLVPVRKPSALPAAGRLVHLAGCDGFSL